MAHTGSSFGWKYSVAAAGVVVMMQDRARDGINSLACRLSARLVGRGT